VRLIAIIGGVLVLSASAAAQEPAPEQPQEVPETPPETPETPRETPPAETPPAETPPAQTPPAETPPVETPPDTRMRLIVIDAASYGIDPVVGQHVSQQMRDTGNALGYHVLTKEESVAAAQRMRMPYPPAPADLWRVTHVAEASRGAFARVWAHAGSYVIEVSVASLDGSGPFFARGNAGAQDLHAVVDRVLREALPPPSVWRTVPDEPVQPPATEEEDDGIPEDTLDDFDDEEPEEGEEDEPSRRLRRWHLTLQTEGAIGTSQDIFYNHLVGTRLDFRISREVLVGLYVGYANLRGKGGRVHNVLTYLQIEDRVRIISSSDITVPLRLGVGYLPFNGPYIRIAAGLNIPLNRDFQLGFDILAPTFWILPDRTAVSMDLAAEIIWRL
jgi:hypothetical protein